MEPELERSESCRSAGSDLPAWAAVRRRLVARLRRLGEAGEAEDLAQEVLLRAVVAASARDRRGLAGYCFRVLEGLLVDRWRSRARRAGGLASPATLVGVWI